MENQSFSPEHIGVGTVLGERYRIIHQLSSKDTHAVFTAAHTHMGEKVQLQLLPASTIQSHEDIESFAQEVGRRATITSEHLPYILEHSMGPNGEPYVVMEFISGQLLDERVAQQGPLEASDAVRFSAQIAHALQEAHSGGLSHCLLHPQQVCLVHEEHVKLLGLQPDFPRGVQQHPPAPYIAPEQADAPEQVGPATDIYQLGMLLFYMLTGQAPLQGEVPRLPEELTLPHALKKLHAAMTSPLPQKRPNARKVYNKLRALQKQFQPGIRSFSHTRYVQLLVAGVCLASVVWAFWPLSPKQIASSQPLTNIPLQRIVPLPPQQQPPLPAPKKQQPLPSTPAPPKAHPLKKKAQPRKRTLRSKRTFRISSVPPGADIYMPGRKKRVGRTPLRLTLPLRKSVTLTFQREGYFSKKIRVHTKKKRTNYLVRLQAIQIELP